MSSPNTFASGSAEHAESDLAMPSATVNIKDRDLQIFEEDGNLIGGLIVTTGITNANLYGMVEVVVLFQAEFTLHLGDNAILKDDVQILPGNYILRSPKPFQVTNEVPLLRLVSLQTGTRTQKFRDAVRARDDGRCAVTNHQIYGNWTGMEAAHIFPLAYESIWNNQNFSRWITIAPLAGGLINSVQNGLLLRADIHAKFDVYDFTINPDDGYKLVFFCREYNELHGKALGRRLLDSPERPIDQLLRWHFRQAVLVNMKGAGEPILEHDFPPGSDIMGCIAEGPKAKERMELELMSRLAGHFEDLEYNN